ncbi:MAG: flagellar hook-length control protein FliK [Deltaproteobacteria bacterium]|nr:flagellar hook-length control protein FliK [Deltaproteobacteria bacterium]
MPHVASDTKTHVLKAPLPHAAPSPLASERATPFESLLDDGTQAAANRPSASDDGASRTERPDKAQPSARAKAGKAIKAGDGAKSDSKPGAKSDAKSADAGDKTDKPAGDSKTASDDKDATDGKPAAGGDDAKPADGEMPVDVAAVTPADPVPAMPAADAVPTVTAPATDAVPQAAAPVDAEAIAATAKAKPDALASLEAIAATAKTRPDALASLQAGTGKSAADATIEAKNPIKNANKDTNKIADKNASRSQADAMPQTGDADKKASAHARGEAAAKGNHAANAPTPGAVNADTAAPKADADALQPAALSAPSHHAAPAATNLAAAPQSMPQAVSVPLAGVAIEIAGKALAGKNHFEIRLDPPELGRIEVRLDVDRDGNVTSRMIADRPDTLDLLRRDAAGLERALQDAGLKTSNNGLQFSLRDHSTGREQGNGGADTAQLVIEDDTRSAIDPALNDYARHAGHGGGLDIRV